MLNRMLDGMPTRPVVYIVPVVVILVLLFYFTDLKQRCIYQAGLRASFEQAVQNNDQSSIFRLAEITPFTWDKVKIFSKFKPERKAKSCPFGWDWSPEERELIISSDLLTVLIFANKGKLSKYIELNSEQVTFDVFEKSLLPETALFVIKRNGSNTKSTLSLAE